MLTMDIVTIIPNLTAGLKEVKNRSIVNVVHFFGTFK